MENFIKNNEVGLKNEAILSPERFANKSLSYAGMQINGTPRRTAFVTKTF